MTTTELPITTIRGACPLDCPDTYAILVTRPYTGCGVGAP